MIQSMRANIINDSKLNQLFEDIRHCEPEFNGNLSKLHVLLFATVRPSTAEPETGASLALNEGSHGEVWSEGGPCQGLSLVSCYNKH